MVYVVVDVKQVSGSATYKTCKFQWSFTTTSPPVWNNDGQVVELWNGSTLIDRRQFSGNLSEHEFTTEDTASYSEYPANGTRHEFHARVKTYDVKGSPDFAAEKSVTAYSWYSPTISKDSFTLSPVNQTSFNVLARNLNHPNAERLKYENWGGGFRYGPPEYTNFDCVYTNVTRNTRKPLDFGMVERAADHGFIGADNNHIVVYCYPKYSPLTPGSLNLVRSDDKITVNWSAWSLFGNMAEHDANWNNAKLNIYVEDKLTESYAINVKTASSKVITKTNKGVKAEIVVSGHYFDNLVYTEKQEALLKPTTNIFIKIDGNWKLATKVYVKKEGIWHRSTSVSVKKDSVWRE